MVQVQTRAASRSLVVLLLAGASLAACATPQPRYASHMPGPGEMSRPAPSSPGGGRYKVGDPYQVAGFWYVPKEQPNYDETGIASWYGDAFQMQPTANGETFDMNAISAAHATLPLPSIVEVTNLDNGRKLKVRVNDRGPFVGGRVIDLSRAAAHELGYDNQGLARVRVRYVGPATLEQPNTGLRYASAGPAKPLYPIRQDAYAAPQPYAAQPYGRAPVEPVSQDVPFYTPPVPKAPVAVAQSTLAPITGSDLPPLRPAVTAAPIVAASAAAAGVYRVQAGAFSDRDNARRVANSLGMTGQTSIESVERNGVILYRVMLPGSADESQAFALRDRVASLGYGEARVIRPF
jgi:rare lipoprotein A